MYFLTAKGFNLARSLNRGLPSRLPNLRGTSLMGHGLMCAEVALSFRHAARSNPGHELLDWECDWQAFERLGAKLVVPDAHLVYSTREWILDAFIEVDLATEGSRVFAWKIRRYLDLYRGGTWRKNLKVWPIVLTVARLVPHKGQDMGIRALAALTRDFPELRYIMVGEGHDELRLRSLAREVGVSHRVGFVGPMRDDELPEAYATSTIYLGASRVDKEINVEGFGISFLEAGASGIPSVAGDSGGVRSAVRDGETGIVVPPTDHDAIADAIRSLLLNPERRKQMGRAARHAVETHYNWDRVARDTRDFTYQVVGARKT